MPAGHTSQKKNTVVDPKAQRDSTGTAIIVSKPSTAAVSSDVKGATAREAGWIDRRLDRMWLFRRLLPWWDRRRCWGATAITTPAAGSTEQQQRAAHHIPTNTDERRSRKRRGITCGSTNANANTTGAGANSGASDRRSRRHVRVGHSRCERISGHRYPLFLASGSAERHEDPGGRFRGACHNSESAQSDDGFKTTDSQDSNSAVMGK